MTDREFVKLNTSIQTASNTNTISEQNDGTIPAVIELRLPDNLFDTKVGNKKIDSVSMLTTKLRLSMLETPIAQIPLDEELSSQTNTTVSTCKLDVYPWCIDDEGNLQPTPSPDQTDIAFPGYKKHELTFTYRVCTAINPEVYESLPDVIECNSNDLFYTFPKDSRFYDIMVKNNLLDNHLMNMTIPSTHENLKIENKVALIKTVSTLEQMWRDALENAITYAMTGTRQTILITLIDNQWMSPLLNPKPSDKATVHIDELNINACYWKYEIVESTILGPNQLKHACKPDITFKDSSMLFSYDTVAFDPIIPVYWSNSFINNYEYSQQQLLDSYRSNALTIPPPKRVYKFGVNTDGENSSLNYNFSLPNPLDAKVFNIIANKDTRDTFPFLPWIPVDPNIFNKYRIDRDVYKKYQETDTDETDEIQSWEIFQDEETQELNLTLYYNQIEIGGNYTYDYSAGWERSLTTFEPITLPSGLGNYLQANYPLNTSLSSSNYRYVLVDYFYFPANDPGYLQTGHISDTNPEQRYRQTLVLPYPNEGYTSPSPFRTDPVVLNGDGFITGWPHTTTTNHITLEPVITNITYTTQPSTPGRTLINETETQNETSTTDTLEPIHDSWACYYHGDRRGKVILGESVHGNWLEGQTFKNPNLLPEYNTLFSSLQANAFRHLPPWSPDDEWSNGETTIIDGETYILGGLIWVIYDLNYPEDYGNKIYLTYDYLKHLQINAIQQTQLTKTYQVVEDGHTENIPDNTIFPNLLDNTTEEFYLLNGASANMTIGTQEVIQKEKDIFHVNDTITEVTEQRDFLETFLYNENQPPSTIYNMVEGEMRRGTTIDGRTGRYIKYTYNLDTTTEVKSNQLVAYGTPIGDTTYTVYPVNVETTTTDWRIIRRTSTVEEFDSNDLSFMNHMTVGNEKTFTIDGEEQYGTPVTTVDDHNSVYSFMIYDALTQTSQKVGSIYIDQNRIIPDTEPTETYYTEEGSIRHYTVLYRLVDEEGIPNMFVCNNVKQHTVTTPDTRVKYEHSQLAAINEQEYEGNLRLTWEWQNIPTVILSPIQSFVLILNGMNVSQEIHPINIAQPGSSSLTSSIPIVENYYSMATTLRDLHDELVIIKESYSDSAFYKLDTTSGQERTITLTLKYITKDGRLHQVYIPKNGVFTLQLTFGIDYYLT